ncbi:MAG: bacteriohemerythrin [Sulfurospirillaceae bacterium]|nr:bacteriohemerythrin [Sulfurospirillaceae bacterium]
MSYWVWDPSFSVNIAVIDDQHKRIIEYINELNSALLYDNKQKVTIVLHQLIDYTISHLAFEESLMQEAGYEKLEPHKKVHASFVGRIDHFKERSLGGEDITRALMNELQVWLLGHIQHDDKDYMQSVTTMLEKKDIVATKNQAKEGWLKSLVDAFFKK